MNILKLFDLQLFAEGASANPQASTSAARGTPTAASGTAAASTGDGAAGDAGTVETAAPKSKRKAKADPFENVKFGIQPGDPDADADADNTNAEGNAEGTTPDAEDNNAEEGNKPKTYTEDEYKKGVEDAIKRRFKKNDSEKKAMAPILRYASEALGVDIDDIEAMSKAADDARKQRYQDEAARTGNDATAIETNADNAYNVRNYRQELDSIREANEAEAFNSRMAKQEAAVREAYPEFDYGKEIENPAFRSLLRAGFDMKNAYESVHSAEIQAKIREDAMREAREQVSASVAAGANRPMEGGAVNPSAQVITDPENLTKAQRAEIKRRVKRGEKIIW